MTGMLPTISDAAVQARAWCHGRDAVEQFAAFPQVTPLEPAEPEAAQERKPREWKRWKIATVACFIILVALGLAAYAAAASYESVSHLAAAKNVPLSSYTPAGIDGGLFGVIVIDIALTWAGQPLGWLRLMARLFAAGTIAANASAGWPDPAGVGLRIAAPALFVVLTEVARAVLLRRNRDQGVREEGIPLARWLIAPAQTFAMWRRMMLWRVRDYGLAVELDLSRRRAIVALTSHYAPADWRKTAPADLVWMLRNGVRMTEALDLVAKLVAPPPVRYVAPVMAPPVAPESGPAPALADGPHTALPPALPAGPSAAPGVAPQAAPATTLEVAPAQAAATVRRPASRLVKGPQAERARTAYRKSLREGQPISDRELGKQFGRSRNWGAARIRECDGGPQLAGQTAQASG